MISVYYLKDCELRKMFELFISAEDETFEVHLNKYNVIQLDINAEYRFENRRLNFFCNTNIIV